MKFAKPRISSLPELRVRPLRFILAKLCAAMALGLAFAFAAIPSSLRAQPEPAQQQLISLSAGWNLISIQVGNDALPVGTFKAALTDPARLIEIWGYQPSGNSNVPGVWQSFQPLNSEFPSDLTALQPGRGYWVNVASKATCVLTGAPWNGSVSLVKGWNLVGFPGLNLAPDEVQDPASVFGASFDRIQQVWTFDSVAARFVGYDLTAVPQLKDLNAIQAGHGYWVYSIDDQPLVLAGSPYVSLPADSDFSPLQAPEKFLAADPRASLVPNPAAYIDRAVRYRSMEDVPFDLNGNGILDDPETQDTLLFEIASDAVPLTIGNRGTGAVTWWLENNVPWLYTAAADQRTWPKGAETRPKTASGTVSAERDTLILYVDRAGMLPGRLSNQSVVLWVGGQRKLIKLLVDVPEIDGDWRGYATTTRVGGRSISLGEVRLALSVFRPDDVTPGGFRAVLNREQAILFPRDVYMDGIFYAGEQFKLTTNFEMPPGDRNAPPYSDFPAPRSAGVPMVIPADAKAAARADRDFNGDGKVDVMNPFPFGVRREITLLGRRVTPNRLEGSYVESIRGLLPPATNNELTGNATKFVGNQFLATSAPVFIEGTFVLERRSFMPSQRSVANETVSPDITVGGTGSGTRVVAVNIVSAAKVSGITVTVDLDLKDLDPALVRLSLISPNGTSYTLHDYAATFAKSYTLPSHAFQGEPVGGEWNLLVEWGDTSGVRATLSAWTLKIEGSATHNITGRVVRSGDLAALAGVGVRISGGVSTRSVTTAVDGRFVFSDLSENQYSLQFTRPGFKTANLDVFVSERDEATEDFVLTALDVTDATKRISASPGLGYEPLDVDFQALLPVSYDGTSISWDWGDGSAQVNGALSDQIAPSHIYEKAGLFTPIATLSGGGLPTPVVLIGTPVHVHRRLADSTVAADKLQFIGGVVLGAGAARVDVAAADPSAAPFLRNDEKTVFINDSNASIAVKSATIYQESQIDIATFDLDRFPFGVGVPLLPFNPTAEDTDYGRSGVISSGGQVFVFYNTNAIDNGATATDEKWDARGWGTIPAAPAPPSVLPALPSNTLYQSNAAYEIYTPTNPARPERLRMVVTLGGFVFAIAPSPMGDLQLQPGRTLK